MNILIIEGKPDIYNFLKGGLKEEGYPIILASDRIKGAGNFNRFIPNPVVLDWILPGIYGIDICKEIHRYNQQKSIVLLTVKDAVKETINGLRAGSDGYIKKTFFFEELLKCINIYFKNRIEDKVIKLGDISLNKSSHQVLYKKWKVFFTQREYVSPEFLIRNKGNIRTKDKIINKIRNINFEYDTGIIGVFMNSLRKKLSLG